MKLRILKHFNAKQIFRRFRLLYDEHEDWFNESGIMFIPIVDEVKFISVYRGVGNSLCQDQVRSESVRNACKHGSIRTPDRAGCGWRLVGGTRGCEQKSRLFAACRPMQRDLHDIKPACDLQMWNLIRPAKGRTTDNQFLLATKDTAFRYELLTHTHI